jgi:outer membrane immunogenic protein
MRLIKVSLSAVLIALTVSASAQSRPAATIFGVDQGQIPAMEIGLNFTYIHANAPPSQCGCFSLYGGGGTLVVNAPRGLSLVADISTGHANAVDNTTQNITIVDYLGGLRYSYRTGRRYTPYAEALAGNSQEISNYTYVQNANALAAGGGLGLSTVLSRRIAWNVEADYLYSRLPNANNNRQSDLRIVTGIIFRFPPR